MSDVIEINVQTGEQTARPYTQAELDAIAVIVTPPAPPTPTLADLQAQLAVLQTQIAALANSGGQ